MLFVFFAIVKEPERGPSFAKNGFQKPVRRTQPVKCYTASRRLFGGLLLFVGGTGQYRQRRVLVFDVGVLALALSVLQPVDRGRHRIVQFEIHFLV